MKLLVILAFLAILGSLGSALFLMMRTSPGGDHKSRSKKMARALTLRITLSIVLFLCILVAWKLGYVQPTGIRAGQ